MSWWLLLLIITLTWCLVVVLALAGASLDHVRAKTPDSERSHVSVVPLLPICPMLFFGAAKLLDLMVWPWGTRIIFGMHLALAGVVVVLFVIHLLRGGSIPGRH